jgi:hypothetical protein
MHMAGGGCTGGGGRGMQVHSVHPPWVSPCLLITSYLKIFYLETDTDSRSEDSDTVPEEGNRGRYRYQRRKGRKVIDLKSCLDDKNYVLFE